MKISERVQSALKGWFGQGLVAGTTVYSGGVRKSLPTEREAFEQNTIVQGCLGTICREFVTVRLATATTGPDGKDEYDHATPFARRMLRPIPGEKTGASRLLKAAVASYKLDGNAYFQVTLDSAGDPTEIWYVPHWAIEPVPIKGTGRLSHYEITLQNGTKERREPSEIVHVADGVDPNNPLKGRSATKCLFAQALTDNEADEYSAEIIRNPAIAGWAVLPTGEKDPGPDNADAVERKINAKFGKGGNRGGVFVAGFRADVKTLGFSPEQLVLDKLRKIPEERISMVLNVPAIVAGLGAGLDRSTFANMEEARRYFVRGELLGLWTEFADAFTLQLPGSFDEEGGERAAFDTRNVVELQEPLGERWTRFVDAYQKGVIMRSQALEGLGYKAKPGDELYFTDLTAGTTASSPATAKARMQTSRRTLEALGLGREDDGS